MIYANESAIDAHLDEQEHVHLVGDQFIGTCDSCKRGHQLVEHTAIKTRGVVTFVNWCVDYFTCCEVTTERDYSEGKEVY